MAGYDVLMSNEWYPHDVQVQMIKAGVKYPIKYTLGKQCYIPAFGDMSMRTMIQETGGNALFGEDRTKLCLVVTRPVQGFNYEKAMFGSKAKNGDFVEGFFPYSFSKNACIAQQHAMNELSALTDQKYSWLGSKLSPLSSGLANIVIYVRFDNACPFEKQFYSNQIRFIPSPYISEYEEPAKCIRTVIEFYSVDEGLFKESYEYMQNLSINELNCRLRHIKLVKDKNELHVVSQVEDDEVLVGIDAKHEKIGRMLKAAFNRTYIFKAIRHDIITMV
jgi:hypothetical protein